MQSSVIERSRSATQQHPETGIVTRFRCYPLASGKVRTCAWRVQNRAGLLPGLAPVNWPYLRPPDPNPHRELDTPEPGN